MWVSEWVSEWVSGEGGRGGNGIVEGWDEGGLPDDSHGLGDQEVAAGGRHLLWSIFRCW